MGKPREPLRIPCVGASDRGRFPLIPVMLASAIRHLGLDCGSVVRLGGGRLGFYEEHADDEGGEGAEEDDEEQA